MEYGYLLGPYLVLYWLVFVKLLRNFMGSCITKTHLHRSSSTGGATLTNESLHSTLAPSTGENRSLRSSDDVITTPCVSIDPGNQTNTGYLMHEAIVQNDIAFCANLLELGFPVNSPLRYSSSLPQNQTPEERERSEFLGTALHVSCIYRRPEIAELLLHHAADPNITDKFGRTPLILTVTYWPRIFLLGHTLPPSNEENQYYDYLKRLHLKSYHCLESLCLHMANVNQPYGLRLETPLHLAAKYHIATCADLLLRHGAQVNSRDLKGMTPLHYACNRSVRRDEGYDIIQLLLMSGADIDAADDNLNTPLHLAAINGCDAFIRQLLQQGADADRANAKGLTPLYLLLDDIRNIRSINGLSAILNETTYIRIFDNNQQLPLLLGFPELKGVQAALVAAATQPPPLFLVCRQIIRKTIGIRNLRDEIVNKLPCPTLLKSVLISRQNPYFSDWDEWCEPI